MSVPLTERGPHPDDFKVPWANVSSEGRPVRGVGEGAYSGRPATNPVATALNTLPCGLAHTLHDAGLIDEYRLLVFPVILGQGKRLFRQGCVPATLGLVDTQVTSAGAVAHTFRPAEALGGGSFFVEDGREAVRG